MKTPEETIVPTETEKPKKERKYNIDCLRVFSCFLVIIVHAGESYYMCPEYALCDAPSSIWGSVYAAWARACVPLFVMVTGYFVLPVREPTSTFVKKRFSRIIIPFFIWLFVYALYNFLLNKLSLNQFIQALLRIPINYGVDVGHLWYIYMSFGLDLIFPIITPWIRSATKKDFHYLLSIWNQDSIARCFLVLLHIHLGLGAFIRQVLTWWATCDRGPL
ncbi:putative transmembrane acyltransferase [Blattamonas nauphoetae]|uniref:Transmembrane acyltransferase n=1 Tax=Blattamonas nauphoetae TaxID=2049346 RepID=A0ABQ9XR82_9EUKA|nr:putative transmembrane acyltransferase [Blattamonas nauphoetae]